MIGCPVFWPSDPGPTMSEITSYPGQAYDYIDHNYGLTGLIVAGVMIVVGIVSMMVWFDRRK
jgi:hypothetical protein